MDGREIQVSRGDRKLPQVAMGITMPHQVDRGMIRPLSEDDQAALHEALYAAVETTM